MTSIFLGSIHNSLERLQASTKSNDIDIQQLSNSGSEAGDVFSAVLTQARGNTEHTAISKDIIPRAGQAGSSPRELSNLQLPARVNPGPLPLPPPVVSVSNQTEAVKSISPANAPIRPPSTPIVVQAAYTNTPQPKFKPGPRYTVSDESQQMLEQIIQQAGKRHGIAEELSLAVAQAESSLRPGVISRDGHRTKGLFQLKDSTGMELARSLAPGRAYEPFNPELNAHLGVGYLKQLHGLFEEPTQLTKRLRTVAAKSADDLEKLAVASFNAGQGRVARAQHKAQVAGLDPSEYSDVARYLPQSTREYVERVMKLKNRNAEIAKDSVLT